MSDGQERRFFVKLRTGLRVMTTPNELDRPPLWLAIERKIAGLGSHDLAHDNLENAIQGVARALDQDGENVSRNAGNMLAVRSAISSRVSMGRSLMGDLDGALKALTLEGLGSPYAATVKLIDKVGAEWPALKRSERRPDILKMVERLKLDLLVEKARALGEEGGIRLLIEEELAPEIVVERMGSTQGEYDRVLAAVQAERAERARVRELLENVKDKAEADRVRRLLTSDVTEDLIIEVAGVDPSAVDDVKRAMEEEMAEKRRLAEEAAAKKAAEAAGPALEDIPPEEMLEHIEAIREILDFSDVEKEIRVMCEQSGIPKDLVETAISDPDRLDELEAEAEG
jgi:hypothetical protein